jgi:hypothetical protein
MACLNFGTNSTVRELVTCGANVAIESGLIRRQQVTLMVTGSAYNTGGTAAQNILPRENMMKATALIIVSNNNWWLVWTQTLLRDIHETFLCRRMVRTFLPGTRKVAVCYDATKRLARHDFRNF